MNNIKNTISRLCDIMTVSGFEGRYRNELLSLFSEFGEVSVDKMGNYIVTKKSKKEGAPLLLIDAHIDEIGMAVTKIHDGGFLSMTSLGGIDAHVLQSTEVEIFGKERIYGVITSTPPHLRTGDTSALEKAEELLEAIGQMRMDWHEIVTEGLTEEEKKLLGGILDKVADNACAHLEKNYHPEEGEEG